MLRRLARNLLPGGLLQMVKRMASREESELHRIRRIPRYREFRTDILGPALSAPDSLSFVNAYQAIFKEKIYEFRPSTPKPLIIDGGANIGLSVLFFKRSYPDCRVIAFEPDPKIFAYLEKNLSGAARDNVQLVPKALWDSERQLHFDSEGSDAGRIASNDRPKGDLVVSAVRLRNYLTEKIDLLKLDVEGAELVILEDCKESLVEVKNIFVEYHSRQDRKQEIARLFGILEGAGFRLHVQPEMTSGQPFLTRNSYLGYDLQLRVFGFRPPDTSQS